MSNVTKIKIHKAKDHGELEPGDQWYWSAIAANGEIVATGEMHPTHANATRSAMAVFPHITPETIEFVDD